MPKTFIFPILLSLALCAASVTTFAQVQETVEVVFAQEMSLRVLAEQYLGNPDEWKFLLAYNGLQDLAELRPGMKLTIPVASFQRTMQLLHQATETARLANMEGAGVLSEKNIAEANRLLESAAALKNSGKLAAAENAAREAGQWADKAFAEAKAKKIQAVSAILAQKDGTVQSRKPEQPVWADAALKQALIEQERVRTLAASLAGLLFADGSKISLSENSLAVIGAMKANVIKRSFQAEVTVLQGDVLAHLSALGGGQKEFIINAPGVDTTIRSKRFRTTRDEAQVTRIANYDGEIDVEANQGKVTIKKDEGTKIEQGKKPTDPQKLLPPPTMSSPTVNQVFFTAAIGFEWEAVANAKSYQVEISAEREFAVILEHARVSATRHAWHAPQKGVYYYRMYTLDKDAFAGHFSDPVAFYVNLDTDPPYLSVFAPAEGEVILATEVVVQGAVEKGATLTINSLPVEVDANGDFEQILRLEPGAQTITVMATDTAQNTTQIRRRIVCNTAAQLLTLDTPSQIVTNRTQVTLKGSKRPQTNVEINDAPVELPEQFTYMFTLPEGKHAITIKALSPQGDIQTVPLAITVDLTAPEITLEAAPASTREPKLNIAGALSEPAALLCNGQPVTLEAQRFNIPILLQEGDNPINLTATDPAGNAAAKTLRVLLDTTPPEITRAACIPSETKGGEIIACEVSAQDRGSGLAKTGSFTLAVAPGGQVVKGILTFNPAKALFEGSVFMPPGVKGKVSLKELRLQDRLGNEIGKPIPN